MKKWTILMPSLLMMIFALAACGSGGTVNSASHSTTLSPGTSSKQQQSQDQTQQNQGQSQQQQSQAQQQAQQQLQKQIQKGLVDDNETVAVVNGAQITGKDYNAVYPAVAQPIYTQAQQQGQLGSSNAAAKQAKQQTIDTVIGQELILQDAKAKGITAPASKVQSQYDQLAKQYGGQKKLESLLKAQNMTQDDLKTNISRQIVYQGYVDNEIGTPKVSDQEIQQYYDQYAKGQKSPPKLKDV